MSRRLITLSVGAVLLIVLGFLGARLPVPYAALGPGPTVDTLGTVDGKQVIAISGEDDDDFEGHLQLTTVGVLDELNLLNALKGWIDGEVSVVPREEVYPPGKTEEEVDQENTQEIVQSQDSAEAAALAELDFPLEILVRAVDEGSPSKGRLEPGDVITSLNGEELTESGDLIDRLAGTPPGSRVGVGYTRAGKPATAEVTTASTENREGSVLGIRISYERVAPFDIDFEVGNIGGPSAGLMFALGIIEKVDDEDLTGGRFVAGTGTIDPEGNVGPIGGVQLKLMGAKRDGATVFLVPKDNCAEAIQDPPEGLRLIRVETLSGAIESLRELDSGGNPPGC